MATAPIPKPYSIDAFAQLTNMMNAKFKTIRDEECSNDLLLMNMSKKLQPELNNNSKVSVLAIISDALIDILMRRENTGLTKLSTWYNFDTEISDAYLVSLAHLSRYERIYNELPKLVASNKTSVFLLKAYDISKLFGDFGFTKNILDKFQINQEFAKDAEEKMLVLKQVEEVVMQFISKSDYKEIHSVALNYAEKNSIYISDTIEPNEDDFALIFNVIAKPDVIAKANLDLSYELSQKGLLDSGLIIGFEYDESGG